MTSTKNFEKNDVNDGITINLNVQDDISQRAYNKCTIQQKNMYFITIHMGKKYFIMHILY